MSGHVKERVYVVIFLLLVVLTAATVYASTVDLGHTGNKVVGMAIAASKALLVAFFFMHLKYDRGWIYAAAIFPMILFFVFVFALWPDIAFELP